MSAESRRRFRLTARDWVLAVVVLVLAGATLMQAWRSSSDRDCFEEAIAERSSASRSDWRALDELVQAYSDSEGQVALEQEAIDIYMKKRAESERVRDENQVRGGCSG